MGLKERTKEELESKINDLEYFIHKKGVGSKYLSKVERMQRDINIMLVLGVTTTFIGLTAWMLNKK